MKTCCLIVVFFLCALKPHQTIAQAIPLKNYATALNNLRELKPVEKLYLQTDKPYYTVNDTLRFKAYLLNADFLTPATRSGLLYIELDDEKGKTAKRIMVPVTNGLAWGDMALDSAAVPNGSYTLRAYTNWMRNFGEDYIFKKTISITKSDNNPLLVNANFKQAGNKVEGVLSFSLLNGRVPAFRDVELKVMHGRKNLSKNKIVTGLDGSVKVNFDLPVETGALSIEATIGGNILKIPANINRPENIDLQFMPEGGNMIAGFPAKVGFKALSEDGKAVNINGNILNSKGAVITMLSSTHAGMGSFTFTPAVGEAYFAAIAGVPKKFSLPAVKVSGTRLSVNSLGADSLRLTVSGTPDAAGTYNLVAQTNGVVCFVQTVKLNGTMILSVDKKLFPTGITKFTLFNNYQPLNERIVFINHHDEIRVNITSNKVSYTTRDSVALNITVCDKDCKPVQGNFSLAVTDNSQVKPDSLGSNIMNHFLLTADLKGDIEEPGYYFKPGKEADLDNLLLTQGWVGYTWQEAFKPVVPYTFQPEQEFVIRGRVSNALGKPLEKSNVILVANHPLTFKDTITDNTGRFVFKGLFPVDTGIFKLQARNKRGKEMNVKIDMEELKFPAFSPSPVAVPWYVNIDSTLLNKTKTKAAQAEAISSYRGEGRVLKQVNIKDKKIIKGSKNLNGPGEADQIIGEEELVKANKMTLEELLVQKVKGFQIWGPGKPDFTPYVINHNKVSLIIDGFNVDYPYTGHSNRERYFFMKQYMDYFTAEDITGIEVMFNLKYIMTYNTEYLNSGGIEKMRMPPAPNAPIAYLEITTRSKQGPFMKVTPGTYLYKTLPFSVAKVFYSPKYTVKNKTIAFGTDLRSTIFWEPNVLTDNYGKATVSFYSADKAAEYTAIIEGTDMEGQFGFGTQKIKISQ